MSQTIESKTKHLSLKLSTCSSISVTTKQRNGIGLPITSSIVLISRLVAMACSISLRVSRRRLGMSRERLWPKGTLSSCTGDTRASAYP
jgi:hypothetical protein